MNITWKQLNNLPVFTESGNKIGRVCEMVCCVETLSLTHIEVKRSALKRARLLIHQTNIISISEQKVIVKDTAVQQDIKQKQKKEVPLPNPVLSARTE